MNDRARETVRAAWVRGQAHACGECVTQDGALYVRGVVGFRKSRDWWTSWNVYHRAQCACRSSSGSSPISMMTTGWTVPRVRR